MESVAEIVAVVGMVKPALTLQWILWLWCGTVCGEKVGFRWSVIEAMEKLTRCRTGAFGTRIYHCPEHGDEVLPNSCRRRDCPECVGNRSFGWSAMVERRLLACEHFHVVFTLTDKLLPYWRHNRAMMAHVLFEAASGVLKELLADPRYVGGTPAILGVLHTHGSALTLHPHVHMLVSSVGLAPDGTLVRTKKRGRLVPYKVIRRKYQVAFLHLFARYSAREDFHLPKGTTGAELRRLIDELFKQSRAQWNVRVFARTDPAPVVRYLSRSVYGGPIRNNRIVSVDEHHVVFQYVDWRSREEGSSDPAPDSEMRLGLDPFVRRWSEHVADPGQKTVRYWGLFAPGAKADLDRARELLGQEPVPEEAPTEPGDAEAAPCCPKCGAAMTVRELPPALPVLSRTASAILRSRASPLMRNVA